MFKYLILAIVLVFIIGLVPAGRVGAQDGENFCETLPTIVYGDDVSGNISDAQYFDAYCFDGNVGDEIVIDLNATQGNLDTYLRLFDPFAEQMYAENDDVNAGTTDSQIEFTLPDTATYLIFVSRYEFDEGTSSGSFDLTLTRRGGGTGGLGDLGGAGSGTKNDDDGGNEDEIADPSQVITISCDTGETLYGGIQFGFININPGFTYTVTVFGLGDFDPVVAVETEPGVGTCNDDEIAAAGSFVAVPGEGSVMANRLTAQVRFSVPRAGSSPIITVGSFNGMGGRFAMVIEGLAINPSDEADGFVIRVPEATADEPLGVYMISRYIDLDPYLSVAAGEGLDEAFGPDNDFNPDFIDFNNLLLLAECDDAGTGVCEDTPAMPGGGIDIVNGSDYVTGELDAGLQFVPESTEPFLYIFTSYSGQSSGTYAIAIMGSVPSVRLQ